MALRNTLLRTKWLQDLTEIYVQIRAVTSKVYELLRICLKVRSKQGDTQTNVSLRHGCQLISKIQNILEAITIYCPFPLTQ
jgi:hypothetical protein